MGVDRLEEGSRAIDSLFFRTIGSTCCIIDSSKDGLLRFSAVTMLFWRGNYSHDVSTVAASNIQFLCSLKECNLHSSA